MNRDENLSRISIVLAFPQDSQNIGSVCRAMKTMGITKLKIVREEPVDETRVAQLAVHAYDIYQNAKKYTQLSDALKDEAFSVAFTRRQGKFRKLGAFNPQSLAEFIKKHTGGGIALVFGRESNGLSDDEVDMCNSICTIQTSDKFPSLNLSQAVQIACYSLFTNLTDYPKVEIAVDQKRIEKTRDDAIKALSQMEFFKEDSLEKQSYSLFIKDFLSRASFSENEIKRVDKFFNKIYYISKYKQQKH